MSATAATHGLAALLIAASCGGGGKSTIDARSDAGGIDAPIVDDAPATDTRVTDAPATTDTPIDTPTTDAPTIDMPVPPASCFDNWKTVYLSAPNELVPGQDDLSWRDGTLYVGHSSTQYAWVFSVPDHGGDKNLLYEGHLRSYWVENDRLLYAQNYDLFDMPRAGGPPTKVLHYGDKYYDTSGGDSVVARNLDSTAIYWLFPYTSGLMLWRHLRSGGEDTMLATVPASDSSRPISWLRQAKGQLVLSLGQASLTGLPYAATVPKTGGALLPLPIYGPYSSLLAASKDGALLWSRNDTLPSNNGLPPPVVYSFARADIDGTPPAAFPTTIPQDATPVAAWAAGSRAWYVATSEVDAVGMAYLSIWYLPANGAAFSVGCDSVLGPPDAGKANPSKLTAGLAADGAFYASVQRQDGHWMVARADNTGAHADTGDPGSAGGASGAGGAGGTGGAAGTGGGGANCPSLPSTGGFGGSGPVLTEFLIPGASSNPMSIAPGPDGTLWFGESARGRIGRITTEGCISELPNGGFASDIVVGPDNYAWFTSGMFIGRMLSDGSLLRLFKLSPASSPSNLTFGPDGNVWFPSTGQPSAIVRLTPAGKITMFTTTFSLTNPRGAVAAPDGNIWFSETNYGSVARVNPTTGVITEVKIPNGGTPGAIELGPDGNLWVISSRGSTPILLRVTTSDVFTEFPLAAGASPSAMCAGPDGNLWVTEPGRNSIARLEPATGTVTEYMLPTINPGLFAITTGPDRNIWFVEASANRIGRLRF